MRPRPLLARMRSRLASMQRQRRDLLAEVDAMSPAQLTHRPPAEGWSALEVVEHLVRVEEGIASRAGKRREPRTWAEATRATTGLALMSLLFRLGRRYRVPVPAVLPVGGATLGDLNLRWDAARAALERTLEAIEPPDTVRPIFRHPILGALTPAQTLTFIARHIRHHRRQIDRIRRSPGYPGP